jgi:hypothetical protein
LFFFSGVNYYGASGRAMWEVGREFGYTLVYAEKKAVNLFFVRDDLLPTNIWRHPNLQLEVVLHNRVKPWFEPNTDTNAKWVIYTDWRDRFGNTPISTWHTTAYGVLFLMHPALPSASEAPDVPQLEFVVQEDAFPGWLRKEEFERHEKKIFSQNGEDGVMDWIYEHIPGGEGTKKYVEFGVQDGSECNSRYFRERKGWSGLMMDGSACFF